ncbi:MAG: Mov34/MPN/PAD-1 family protein [Acidobacteria bacterium]|nr:Mov34/MPN/PAD-1 family protein [Acidobacteriota bacterium]
MRRVRRVRRVRRTARCACQEMWLRQFAATRQMEARAAETRGDLLGFYHSHPDHPAAPSAFDLEHAWPNLRYLIVSVRAGRPEEARSWRLRNDRSAFEEETLVIGPHNREDA